MVCKMTLNKRSQESIWVEGKKLKNRKENGKSKGRAYQRKKRLIRKW